MMMSPYVVNVHSKYIIPIPSFLVYETLLVETRKLYNNC